MQYIRSKFGIQPQEHGLLEQVHPEFVFIIRPKSSYRTELFSLVVVVFRVLSTNFDAQIYYPPYLFRSINGQSVLAPRPRIFSMSSTTANYGGTIDLQIGFGDTVKEISFKSLPSATHSFDSNQRRIKLSFTTNNNLVRVQMPSSGNIAPPGYYYLNVINNQGVPIHSRYYWIECHGSSSSYGPCNTPWIRHQRGNWSCRNRSGCSVRLICRWCVATSL